MRRQGGLWWGSEGTRTETEIHFLFDKGRLAGYTCQMWQGFGKGMGMKGGGGWSLTIVGWDEGKRPIPLPESHHLVPPATPPKLFMTPHFLSYTRTSLGSIPIFSSPVTHFFPHVSTSAFLTHWQIMKVFLDRGSAAAGLRTLPCRPVYKKSNSCIPCPSLCLHTSRKCTQQSTHIRTDTAKKSWRKTTSSELLSFYLSRQPPPDGSSDL